MAKAKADSTTDAARKRKHRRKRAARNRKRVERRLELSERRIVPRSELTPEEQKIVAMPENGPPPSWAGIIIQDGPLSPSPSWEEAAAVLDRAAAEQIYGRPAKRDRPVSTADAVTPVAPSPSAPTPPVQRINSKNWVVETLWRLNNKGKIPDKISKTKLAQTIVDLITAARTAGVPIRALTRDYVRSHLKEWIGGWPIPRHWPHPGAKF
jgi:hypothetical protein